MGALEFLNRGLRDRSRAVIGWSIGVAAYAAMIAAIFPSIEQTADFDELVEQYPEALKSLFGLGGVDLSTGSGFVDTELFNLMLPLLALVLAIGAGSRTLAGEEEAGRLELLFSYPVRRRDATLAKSAAVGGEIVVFASVAFAVLAALSPVFGLDLPLDRLAGALLGLALIAALHGWLAVAVGAAHPSRALAIAVPAALAAFGYLVNGLQSLTSWLHPFRFLSSFWWIGQSPLSRGIDLERYVPVALAALVVLGAGALLIERRDLQVP